MTPEQAVQQMQAKLESEQARFNEIIESVKAIHGEPAADAIGVSAQLFRVLTSTTMLIAKLGVLNREQMHMMLRQAQATHEHATAVLISLAAQQSPRGSKEASVDLAKTCARVISDRFDEIKLARSLEQQIDKEGDA